MANQGFTEPKWPSEEAENRAYLAALEQVIICLLEQLVRDGTLGWERASELLTSAAAEVETGHPIDDHAGKIIRIMEEELYRRVVPRNADGMPLDR